jgi:hypothetical protein
LASSVLACRHVTGRIHEITAKFDQPVRLDDYMFFDRAPVSETDEPVAESSSPA